MTNLIFSFNVHYYMIGAVILLIGLFYLKTRKKRLPGPLPLPIIGNVLSIGQRPHVRFAEWAKIYGPVFQVKMGSTDLVILSDPKLIKEIFCDYASTGRPTENPVIYEFSKGPYGVMLSDGTAWECLRKFTLHALRDLGFAKTSMEGYIMNEVKTMLHCFQTKEGTAISGNRIFNAAVVNSLWRLLSGERHTWEKPQSAPLFDVASEFFEALAIVCTNGVLFAPILRFIAPGWFSWKRYVKAGNDIFHLIETTIKEHRAKLNPSDPRNQVGICLARGFSEVYNCTSSRDFIDRYLLEIDACTDPNSSFYKELGYKNLVSGVFDLFIGGSETTSHTLSWALLYLSEYLEVQQKVQMEIDSKIGKFRYPTLQDKSRMPYMEAMTLEILRLSTVLSMGVAHRMLSTKTFRGHCLRKGTAMFANLYGVHHDPLIWGDPFSFRPERFLNADETKVIRHEALLPFADGKRRCMGETLARDTLFLFLSSIFQQFHVLPDPTSKPKDETDFEPSIGYFLVPKPFKVVMVSRNDELLKL